MGALRSGSRMLQHGPEEVGHLKWDEEASRVEIVLARVVHDSQEASAAGASIRDDLVDLPLLEVVVSARLDAHDVIPHAVSRGRP